jgi:L-alanine-DL-glutamate epimerase-like enolase superfamily enzyme
MPVASVRAHVLRHPLPTPILDARAEIRERAAVLVRVRTADGLEGWGEAACFGGAGRLVAAAVEHLAEGLIGADVAPRDWVRRTMAATAHYGQRGVVVSAISGIEIALWDLHGKSCGLPVSSLFGAAPAPARIYGTTGFYVHGGAEASRSRLANDLAGVAPDLSGIKIKIGRYGIPDDLLRARMARDRLGPERILIVDANNAYGAADAAALGRDLRELGILFFEEPIEFGLPAASAELRLAGGVPIAGYELEPTYHGCEPYLEARAVDYIQPDAIWSGGLGEAVAIADLARRRGIRMVPHNFASVVATAANYHLACISGGDLLEIDQTGNPLAALDLLEDSGWRVTAGTLQAPPRPGLGVDVTEEWLSRFETTR